MTNEKSEKPNKELDEELWSTEVWLKKGKNKLLHLKQRIGR